jgi:hypothetical protein
MAMSCGEATSISVVTIVAMFARSCTKFLQITHWLGSWVVRLGVGDVREAPAADLASDPAAPSGARRCAAISPEAERSASA